MLTVERLREVLDYDSVTGIFRWRLRKGRHGGTSAGQIAGRILLGYRCIRIDRHSYMAHRLAWLLVYGEWPKGHLDHRNGIRDDNRIVNLRIATRSQNGANAKLSDRNSTGFKGVSRDHDRWRARIIVGRKEIHLGRFASKEEAHAAYMTAAQQHFGEFARSE